MPKTRKLMTDPQAFFRDAMVKRFPGAQIRPVLKAAKATGKPTAILVGFSKWKNWMDAVLAGYHVVYLGHSPKVPTAILKQIHKFPNPHVFAWSYKFPADLPEICAREGVKLTYVEDGFLRSVGLGTQKSRPMSLVFDDSGMHFDRSRVSDLDRLLNTYDFATDSRSLALASKVANALRDGLTKYVAVGAGGSLIDALGLDANRRRILVCGQVEDDMSLKHGMEGFMTGNEFVARVAIANPDATILYRPHPESVAVRKKHYSDPRDVAHLCHVISGDWSLKESFAAANEAHVITSLAGIEAKIAGLDVHTYGMPFYAGWGFTHDHGLADTPDKRMRTLTVEEVVAGAYVLYPRYYHPLTSETIGVDEGLDILTTLRNHMVRVASASAGVDDRNAEVDETPQAPSASALQ